MPKLFPSSKDTDVMVARVAPAILELLGDDVPRSRRTIVAALADRYPKDEVKRTLMRLAVTGQIDDASGSRSSRPLRQAERVDTGETYRTWPIPSRSRSSCRTAIPRGSA
jgi:hypothetical protein